MEVTIDNKNPQLISKKVNKITEEVFKKTDKGVDLVVCQDVNDFFRKLGI
jgi:hypothetical protein